MSDASKNPRRVFSGVDTSGVVPVEYRFSHARNGNRHLVVVFAGAGAPKGFGMSNGVLGRLRANVLWIRDSFDGAYGYSLCKGMDFSLEQSVAGLIARVMTALSLTPDACTAIGSSNGGSAALHFGLKYGFRNIVSTVPQFLIGSHLREGDPGAARAVMGEVTEEKVRVLDSVLPDLVRGGAGRSANIYLISSPQDEQFTRHVEPVLALFRGHENFNFLFNDSPLVRGHGSVTAHNAPAVMGLLNLLVEGLAPRIGAVRYGHEQPGRDTSVIDSFLAETAQVRGAEFPPPVVVSPAAGEHLPGNLVRFRGSAPGAVRVSLWENGKFLASPPVAPDGSWVWERDEPWSKGRHVVRLFAVDVHNYHSRRSEVAFVAADHAPAPGPAAGPVRAPAQQLQQVPQVSQVQQVSPALLLSVSAPVPHQQVAGPVPRFMGFAPGAVRVDFHERGAVLGSCAVMADGSWVWESGWAWPEGEHVVEVVAVDAVGNASTWSAVPFSVVNTYTVPAHGGFHDARH
ncbi:hypothetical protein AMK16_21050 [Streptomyces sp. CB00455]|uniref:hypothetical protein n=1 Tax=Streptomyces sp. CB00455 TaxID=1703927 RepID=UPI0009400600|nr:hypothetical protein [Streptomyces sp. CB00455]OKK17345.1 hypothetical protein AMK16_21050 [Streptomyces sp. CB00455]